MKRNLAALTLLVGLTVSGGAQTNTSVLVVQHIAALRPTLASAIKRIPLAPVPSISTSEIETITELGAKLTLNDTILAAKENTGAVAEIIAMCGAVGKPYTSNLVLSSVHDTTILGARELLYFHFPAPFEYDRRLHPVSVAGTAYGYPSVHATNLWTALSVIELCARRHFPDTLLYIQRVESRRVAGALEWPSAVAASHALAERYLAILQQSPDFQSRLQMAKDEWR